MQPVHAILLAAGHSSRMGSAKALLPLRGSTFLGHLSALYEGLGVPWIAVLGSAWETIAAALRMSRECFLVNPDPDRGPLSSIRLALEKIPDDTGAIIPHPVDHPLVLNRTVLKLIEAHLEQSDRIIVPRFRGTAGHPTLFPANCIGELRSAPLDQGARWVVSRVPDRVRYLEVDDPGISANIDTPGDYLRWFAGEC